MAIDFSQTNLVGARFKNYVDNQIQLRQQILAKREKSSANLTWENSKSAYVALASSVNIENSSTTVVRIAETETPNSFNSSLNATFSKINAAVNGEYDPTEGVSPELQNQWNLAAGIESEVVVVEGEEGTERLKLLGLESESDDYMGDSLSKKWVLFGGTGEINYPLQGPIDYNAPYATPGGRIEGSYMFKDMGFKAMPGITSFVVKDRNMGSLREISLQLRANDESQFKLIDTLYCRIGYSMFVEWGNTIYYNNQGEYISLQQANPTSLLSDFLNGYTVVNGNQIDIKTNPSNFIKLIEQRREESCGNYDGFFGRVKNFSWSFNPEGYYEITLSLISWGDIIESLTIDGVYNEKPNLQEAGGVLPQPNNSSALTNFLSVAATPSGIAQNTQNSNGVITIESEVQSFEVFKNTLVGAYVETNANYINGFGSAVEVEYARSIVESTLGEGAALQLDSEVQKAQEEFAAAISDPSDTSTDLGYTRLATSVGKIISAHAWFNNKHYYYIRFGDILDFIKDKLLLYHPGANNEPIVDIDTDTDTNLCYYTGMNLSADPSKVMIRGALPFTSGELLEIKPPLKDDVGTIEKLYYMGIIPRQSEVWSFNEAKLEPFESEDPTLSAGKIMNIYFEYQYLIDTIQGMRDEATNKISLYSFIKQLCDTANSCLGGVNRLAIRLKNNNILQIYDQNPIYGTEQLAGQSSIINLFGVTQNAGSFVTNFSIKSELNNDFSTTVAVGAQSQGSVVGEDSTALSKWNYGLIDRYYPMKVDSLRKNNRQDNPTLDEKLSKLIEDLWIFWGSYSTGEKGNIQREEGKIDEETGEPTNTLVLKNYYDVYYFPNFPTDRIEELVKLQKEFFQTLIQLKVYQENKASNKIASNQIGMIPLNIQITMDGLSGIRIYDKLPIDVRFIPNYYPQTLFWVIKGVNHEIRNNKWYTKLDTIAVPKIPNVFDLRSAISRADLKSNLSSTLNNIELQDRNPEITDEMFSPYNYREVTKTNQGLPNHPNTSQSAKMERLIKELMDPIAQHFGGTRLRFTSMFRSESVNTAIGGSSTSQHVKGEAVDITGIEGKSTNLFEIYQWAANNLTYGQLIWEEGNNTNPEWIHISLGTKKQKLRYINGDYKSCNSQGQI